MTSTVTMNITYISPRHYFSLDGPLVLSRLDGLQTGEWEKVIGLSTTNYNVKYRGKWGEL